jgi:hypothetical protein
MEASGGGHIAIVRLLLEAGSDKATKDKVREKNGESDRD